MRESQREICKHLEKHEIAMQLGIKRLKVVEIRPLPPLAMQTGGKKGLTSASSLRRKKGANGTSSSMPSKRALPKIMPRKRMCCNRVRDAVACTMFIFTSHLNSKGRRKGSQTSTVTWSKLGIVGLGFG